jgi:peptidoglycan/LPS O-acetylase OafA/YrhL
MPDAAHRCVPVAPDAQGAHNLAPVEAGAATSTNAPAGAAATAVPDAVAPPPRHPRFPLLDAMRAIAVLAVVVVHVTVFATPGDTLPYKLLLHLNVGVTIFFLISGFLLYRPFIAHRVGGGAAAPALGDYAKRRFLRIFPAYWLILIVLWIVPGVTGTAGGGWLSHLLLVQTLPGTGEETSCVTAILDCGLAQTWSLVAELTFYVLLPFYVLLAARLAAGRDARRWVPLELALLGGLSVLSIVLTYGVFEESPLLGSSVFGFVFWFALGMSLAVLSVGGRAAGGPAGRAIEAAGAHPTLPWVGAIAIYVAIALAMPATPFLLDTGDQALTHIAFGVIALLLMLPAVFGAPGDDGAGTRARGLSRRLLALPPVAWLGLISYGIFLWHYVFTIEFGSPGEGLGWTPLLLVTLGCTIPIAAASYYLLERPVLKLKYRNLRARRRL